MPKDYLYLHKDSGFAFILFVFIAITGILYFAWSVRINQIIGPPIFATLAGLSLAAFCFTINHLSSLLSRIVPGMQFDADMRRRFNLIREGSNALKIATIAFLIGLGDKFVLSVWTAPKIQKGAEVASYLEANPFILNGLLFLNIIIASLALAIGMSALLVGVSRMWASIPKEVPKERT